MGDQVDLVELLSGSVDDVKGKLSAIVTNDLPTMQVLESRGQNRTTLLTAIDAEYKGRPEAKLFSQADVDTRVAEQTEKTAAAQALVDQRDGQISELTTGHNELAKSLDDHISQLRSDHASELKLRDDRIAELETAANTKTPKASGKPLALPEKAAANAALAALKGETSVVLVDDQDVPIADLTPLSYWPPNFEPNGDHALLTSDIEFPVAIPAREVAGAFLLKDGKPIAKASLVQPFGIGAGRAAKLQKRTLSFATS